MKVVMLGNWPMKTLSGGVAVHTVNLVNELSNFNDLELHMVSFSEDSDDLNKGKARITLIKSRRIYYIFPFLAVIRLWSEIKKIKPDIIHLQGSNMSPYLFYVLFGAANIKKVITFHSYPIRELIGHNKLKKDSLKYKFLKWLEYQTIKKANFIITVDTRLKDWIIEEYDKIANKKVQVILNGVNIDIFNSKLDKTNLKMELCLPKEDIIIFHAKAFVPKNGQRYLIEAMPYILKKYSNIKLILAGDGPLKNELKNISKSLNVSNNIEFIGDLPNEKMPEYMAISDIIVIPSIHMEGLEEASSILLAEAMAMEKPVIASNIGGIKETITHELNGLLIPDKDPKIIANMVIKIVENPLLASKLGKNARKYIEKERTWDKIALDTFNIYKLLLDKI